MPPSRSSSSSAGPTDGPEPGFLNDLSSMVFGFAGDRTPVKETLELLNDVVLEFVGRLTVEGVRVARLSGANGISVEAVKYVMRKDPKMRERIEDLLDMHATIKRERNMLRDAAKEKAAAEKPLNKEEEAAKIVMGKAASSGVRKRRNRMSAGSAGSGAGAGSKKQRDGRSGQGKGESGRKKRAKVAAEGGEDASATPPPPPPSEPSPPPSSLPSGGGGGGFDTAMV